MLSPSDVHFIADALSNLATIRQIQNQMRNPQVSSRKYYFAIIAGNTNPSLLSQEWNVLNEEQREGVQTRLEENERSVRGTAGLCFEAVSRSFFLVLEMYCYAEHCSRSCIC